MHNRMLSFSGTALARLHTLVAAVDREIALVPGATTANPRSPRTALDITWSNLVELLESGTETEMRECPECKRLSPPGSRRCGHCGASLLAFKTQDALAP